MTSVETDAGEEASRQMPAAGEVVRLSARVRRITQDNPSIFTGVGTNTHLVGEREIFILDPGPDGDDHFDNLVDAVGAAKVLAVIPTHHHQDHWPLAPRLAEHYGAPTLGFADCGDYRPQKKVRDAELLHADGVTLEAIHTPGHAEDHISYLLREESTLLSGDHVMGWSTSVIAPPGGSLNDYLASLDKLRSFSFARMYPAHGLPIDNPLERIDELYNHRVERTRQAIEALETGLDRIPEMVSHIYADVDKKLHTAAGWSLLAHLQALVEDGRVRVGEESEAPLDVRYELVRRGGR